MKRGKIEMLSDFMQGLNTAIDAASQLVHQRTNIKFMAIRDYLNIIKDGTEKLIKGGVK